MSVLDFMNACGVHQIALFVAIFLAASLLVAFAGRDRRGRARGIPFQVRVAAILGMMGWLFSRGCMLQFLNSLNPIMILFIWYMVLGYLIWILFQRGGERWGYRSLTLGQIAGILLLVFAVMIVLRVESPWAAAAIGQNPSQVPAILYASEDGVTYMIWDQLTKGLGDGPILWYQTRAELLADLTYIATPVILTLLASVLMTPRQFQRQLRETLT